MAGAFVALVQRPRFGSRLDQLVQPVPGVALLNYRIGGLLAKIQNPLDPGLQLLQPALKGYANGAAFGQNLSARTMPTHL